MIHPRHLFIPLLLLVAVLLPRTAPSSLPANPGLLEDLSKSTSELAQQVLGAMVFLRVDQANSRGGQSGTGTGFVIDAMRGLVVTNSHVVGDLSSKLRVTLQDGRFTWGDPIAIDPKTDLAVVRIPEGFARRQIKWGDSDSLRNGDMVMAVGNPLGLTGTTTLGVVAGLHRVLELTEGSYEDFIQHDAFIDHGSSGGPLVNMSGEVVGVNTAIGGGHGGTDAWQGISYAVPSALARRVVEDLSVHKEVRRAYFGVQVADLNFSTASSKGLSSARGAMVSRVGDDSPADHAGILRNDVVIEVDGVEIAGAGHLRARIAAARPGQRLEITIWRNKQRLLLTVTAGRK